MTDYRSFYDKDFIGAWDLHDGDKTITMTKCIGGSLTAPGGRKSKKPVVYFQGSEKGFALNATNGKTIAALYGNMVEQWAGKRITLYKSMTRSPQGDGDVECIRVRPVIPAEGEASAAKASVTGTDDPFDRALSLYDAAASMDDVKAADEISKTVADDAAKANLRSKRKQTIERVTGQI